MNIMVTSESEKQTFAAKILITTLKVTFVILILAYSIWLHNLYAALPSIESISEKSGIVIPGSARIVGFYYHSFLCTDMLVKMQLDHKSTQSIIDKFPKKSERSSATRFDIDSNVYPRHTWWKPNSIKHYIALRWFLKSDRTEIERKPSVKLLIETPASSKTTVYLRYEYPD